MPEENKEMVKFSKSRKPYLPVYLMMLALIATFVFIKYLNKPINPYVLSGAIIFSLIGISATEIHRIRDYYQISDRHIIHDSGYIAKTEKKIHLKSITDIDLVQGIWQRIAGYGGIMVQSASGTNNIIIRNINSPGKFISILEKKMRNLEGKV